MYIQTSILIKSISDPNLLDRISGGPKTIRFKKKVNWDMLLLV